jgi:hypothetical protein
MKRRHIHDILIPVPKRVLKYKTIGMDFLDRTTGELIELTTGGQALTKIGKYRLSDLDQVAIYP